MSAQDGQELKLFASFATGLYYLRETHPACASLDLYDTAVLIAIHSWDWGKDSNGCLAAITSIADRLGCSKALVRRSLHKLKDAGCITLDEQKWPNGRGHRPYLIRISPWVRDLSVPDGVQRRRRKPARGGDEHKSKRPFSPGRPPKRIIPKLYSPTGEIRENCPEDEWPNGWYDIPVPGVKYSPTRTTP
jgi:hypothetical protein